MVYTQTHKHIYIYIYVESFLSRSMKICALREYRKLIIAYLMKITGKSFKYRLLESLFL